MRTILYEAEHPGLLGPAREPMMSSHGPKVGRAENLNILKRKEELKIVTKCIQLSFLSFK